MFCSISGRVLRSKSTDEQAHVDLDLLTLASYNNKTVQKQLKTEKSFQTEKDKKCRKRQESNSVLLEHENKKTA